MVALCFGVSFSLFSQTTVIPDPIFEQALIDLGHDAILDGSVPTNNINGVLSLDVPSLGISDLTGIEDFTSLEYLECSDNTLTSINVTQNIALISLRCAINQLMTLDVTQNVNLDGLNCDYNQLISLDVSQNLALEYLGCAFNQITLLDVTQNVNLYWFWCSSNQLTSLDVSQNPDLFNFTLQNNPITSIDVSNNPDLHTFLVDNCQLTSLDISQNPNLEFIQCGSNNLECLNIQNGNNQNINSQIPGNPNFGFNPNLTCIDVDNVAWSDANWNIDPQMNFSVDCAGSCFVSLNEMYNTPKQLLRIVDLMGRESAFRANTVLIYVYSDGTTERVFEIE